MVKVFLAFVALFLAVFVGYFIFGLEAEERKSLADGVVHFGVSLSNGEVDFSGGELVSSGERTYENFGNVWPSEVRPADNPKHRIVSEDDVKEVYIYESPGYYFYADSKITHDASMHFATLFETTRAYMKALPLGLLKADEESGRSKVLIFGTDAAYQKSGGPVNSVGCYFPDKRYVLVPVSSLELRKGGGGLERSGGEKDNTVLIHELVHQLTPSAYYAHGSGGWFTEGLADYVGNTPYRPGYFWVDPYGDAVMEYVTGYGREGRGGRALGRSISVPRLKDFMLMSYDRFSGGEANRNYGVGLLITYYFFHWEGGGGARRITAFLEGLKGGVSGEEALVALHGGEGFESLERDIAGAWARKGVSLSFGGE